MVRKPGSARFSVSKNHMKVLLGKKIGMSQIFKDDGTVIPVTLIEAGPVVVTQIKTKETKDGYESIQVGFEKLDPKKAKKSQQKKLFKHLREFRGLAGEYKIGDEIFADVFQEGDKVKISGTTKGKGFQGGVKRYGFRGMPASHGHKHVQRHVGSIGQRYPQRTFKGLRMAGHMGDERASTKNLKIVKIDRQENLIMVKGAVPGRRGTLVEIQVGGDRK